MLNFDNYCNFIFLGKAAVGKTCIINRYVNNYFDDYCPATCGAYYVKKEIELPEKGITLPLLLWDVSGLEKFHSLALFYYRYANIVILVYSIINRETFDELKDYWYPNIINRGPKNLSNIFIINNNSYWCCWKFLRFS